MQEAEFQSPKIVKESPLTSEQLAEIHALRKEARRFLVRVKCVDFFGLEGGEVVFNVGYDRNDGRIYPVRYTLTQLNKKIEMRKAFKTRKAVSRKTTE